MACTMEYMLALFFLLVFLFSISIATSDVQGAYTNYQLESSKNLSKASLPTKTIKSEDGELIDCIYIYDQPAFKNPLLKHHTIKITSGADENITQNSIHQTWHRSGSCPDGTVPISRKQTAAIEHKQGTSKSWTSFHPPALFRSKDHTYSNRESAVAYEHAVAYVTATKYYYTGTRGDIQVWKPKVQPNETSYSYIGAGGLGIGDGYPYHVMAGWCVSPSEYGDGKPRVAVFRSGSDCANLCSGFVQTSSKLFLDGPVAPVSVEGGPYFKLRFKIMRDDDLNWVVSVDGMVIGHYPQELLPSFFQGDTLYYGGVVANTNPRGRHTNTEMGSGHFPSEGQEKAAIISEIFSYNLDGAVGIEYGTLQYTSTITKPDCYDMKYLGQQGNSGHAISYGGSGGRNPNCNISSGASLSVNHYFICMSLLVMHMLEFHF